MKSLTNTLTNTVLALVLLASCGYSQTSVPAIAKVFELPYQSKLTAAQLAKADSININFQIRGFCYAYSSKKNSLPGNGEWQSEHIALPAGKDFPTNGFYLVLNANELTLSKKNVLFQKLYVINKSDSLMSFRGQDSRLDIIPEAMDKNGEWKPIGYLPGSTCGNSYHTIKLDEDEYWSFDIPVFKGSFKTKLRYSFLVNNKKYSSNEITAYINEEQFDKTKQEGHIPQNIMDPYTN